MVADRKELLGEKNILLFAFWKFDDLELLQKKNWMKFGWFKN
jgi:hypothetical protein